MSIALSLVLVNQLTFFSFLSLVGWPTGANPPSGDEAGSRVLLKCKVAKVDESNVDTGVVAIIVLSS